MTHLSCGGIFNWSPYCKFAADYKCSNFEHQTLFMEQLVVVVVVVVVIL